MGSVAPVAGFEVAVGPGAPLLFAVLDDGFGVAVGDGAALSDFAVVVDVDVGDASNSAAVSGFELWAELRSSGAAGGGLSKPSADGRETPERANAAGVSWGVLRPPRRPVASRPPVIVSVPPATKATAMVRGLITSLLVPRVRAPGRLRPCSEPREISRSQVPIPGQAYRYLY